MATFGERLKELRQQKNHTQKQMAEILGMTERGFRGYEMGLSTPHYDTLLKLADYFVVPTDYLMGRSDNRYHMDNTPTQASQSVLFDKRLSMDAKSLYMQLNYFALDKKMVFTGGENFFTEYYADKEEFDGLISELESAGYLKIESGTDGTDGKNSGKVYALIQ